MECSKSSFKREVYSNTILPQKIRKISNRQPNFTPKTTAKRRRRRTTTTKKKNPQNQQKERNHKDLSKNHEKEMKETILKINKTKNWFFEKINKIANLQPD